MYHRLLKKDVGVAKERKEEQLWYRRCFQPAESERRPKQVSGVPLGFYLE